MKYVDILIVKLYNDRQNAFQLCEQLVTHTLPVRVHFRVVVTHRDCYHSANSKQLAHYIVNDGISDKIESRAHLLALQLSCRNLIWPIKSPIDSDCISQTGHPLNATVHSPPSVCTVLTFHRSNTRPCCSRSLPSLRAILRNNLTPRINCANETKYIT